ncbi:voltage-dependent calcium channel gamma-like subunit [Rhinoderma darwinii]|uniref:voltage-dependent calcium channel gamma-like subunit n=1 Tax=Rhinoderma darwinii TaxID=43563 RepID=UPI003F662FC1
MRPPLFSRVFCETFLRVLITLSAGSAVVLSSISVCDGHWLDSPGRVFRVWGTCGKESPCSPGMSRIGSVMGVVRMTVSLAIVLAIFGLGLLMVSQLFDDGHSRKKWSTGSVLLIASFFLSSAGTLTYVILLKDFAFHGTFTLNFWCQCVGTLLFFLNGVCGLYFKHISA